MTKNQMGEGTDKDKGYHEMGALMMNMNKLQCESEERGTPKASQLLLDGLETDPSVSVSCDTIAHACHAKHVDHKGGADKGRVVLRNN